MSDDTLSIELRNPSRAVKRQIAGRLCPLCQRRLWWEDVAAAHAGPHIYWVHIQCIAAIVAAPQVTVDPAHLSSDSALD